MEHTRGDENMIRKILDSKYFQIPYKIVKAIIIIVMVTYVTFIIAQRVSGNKSVFGYRIFTVATGSMIPHYNINDVLAVKEVNTDELQNADIGKSFNGTIIGELGVCS